MTKKNKQKNIPSWKQEDISAFLESMSLESWSQGFQDCELTPQVLPKIRESMLMNITNSKGESMSFGEARFVCLAVKEVQQNRRIPKVIDDLDLKLENIHLWTVDNVCKYFSEKVENMSQVASSLKNHKINGIVLMSLNEEDTNKLKIQSVAQLIAFQKELKRIQKALSDSAASQKQDQQQGEEQKKEGHKGNVVEIPVSFKCTLTGELMENPVVASDGCTYERSAIEAHFENSDISPVTGEAIYDKKLMPNRGVLMQIMQWKSNHPNQ